VTWTRIRIESELDHSTVIAILARNDYEVRITKNKVGTKLERYVEYRERVE
jgi:hypothetical protein